MQHFRDPFVVILQIIIIISLVHTTVFCILPCQARGGAPPANDLQSQLNDMLDDSASDNSSILQTREGPGSPLPPAPPTLGDRLQDRTPKPNLGLKNAKLQQTLSMSDDAEMDTQGMQIPGQESKQRQTSEVSGQLKVSVMIMTGSHTPPSPLHGCPIVKKQFVEVTYVKSFLHGTHSHICTATGLA